MKKLFAIILLLFLLSLSCIYLLIPTNLVVNNVTVLQCSLPGANRVIKQKENWKQFWVGNAHLSPKSTFSDEDYFTNHNDTFHVTKLLQNAVSIGISNDETTVSSLLQILPIPGDSIALNWDYSLTTSSNPFIRLQQYRQAVRIKENMSKALDNIKKYLSRNENIYGLNILRTSTVDTLLISTKTTLNAYPETNQIYSMIAKLQAYAKENEARQTGYPMLNITQSDTQHFTIMTALPVNKMLPDKGDISYKRMIRGGFLTATVTGGRNRINTSYAQMEQYFQDYRNISMAIPFMYLITDRSKETDSSKWITKLYFPVM